MALMVRFEGYFSLCGVAGLNDCHPAPFNDNLRLFSRPRAQRASPRAARRAGRRLQTSNPAKLTVKHPLNIKRNTMYFTHKHQPFCVNCDWLQYSVHLKEAEPEIICPEGLRIELCQGNNIFEHRALVFDGRGAKYMTLLWKPYSKVLPQNLMTVQVANEFLYLRYGNGILWSFLDLQKIVDCSFNAIGRLDICIDFQGSEERNLFLRHLNSGHYYVQHKSEGSTWWHDIQSGNGHKKQLHCLTWGSKSSEIKVKIYHKSRELGILNGEEPEKPWICAEWDEAGFDRQNVWRLEFSMTGAGQLRYKNQPITLENVADHYWLLEVLCNLYESRFVCRINQGKRNGHHNDDERVYLFKLPPTAKVLKWCEPKGKDYELPAAITLLRSMMRQVDNPAVMAEKSTFSDYATTILNIIQNYRLDGYFKRTYEQDADDYFNTLWENVGQGLRYTTPSPAKLMD